MTTLPIVLLINLGAGASSVIAKFKPAKPWKLNTGEIFQQVREKKISTLIASPYFVTTLAQSNIECCEIKKIFTGGAPVFPADAKLMADSFPLAQLEIVYGSTEAEPISSVQRDELFAAENLLSQRGLYVGKINPVAEVKIVPYKNSAWEKLNNDALKNYALPDLQYGEIVVAGPHVVKDYLHNEKAFAENKIVEGNKIWHRTGDGGIIDENGGLWLLGRCKQIIHHHGELISPFIYEGILKQISGIKSGTVIMHNNKLTLIIEEAHSHSELTANSKQQIANIIYEEIKFVKNMPLDPRHFSKINYDKLKLMID